MIPSKCFVTFLRYCHLKRSCIFTLVLAVHCFLVLYYKCHLDRLDSLVKSVKIDTFWHPNNDNSVLPLRRLSRVSFSDKFVVVTVCCRDAGKFLPKLRRNLEGILTVFQDYRVLVGESDSSDSTLVYLRNWSSIDSKMFVYSYGKLRDIYSRRTDRIAYCRNDLLSRARENKWIARSELLLVLDADVNANSIFSLENFLSNFQYDFNEWGAMTASQSKSYYDIWALRSNIVNYDCWKEVSKYPRFSDIAIQLFIGVHKVPIPKEHHLIPVQSAFGGFAIYQTRYLTHCRYDSSDDGSVYGSVYGKCEHVSFNECVIQNGGKIFINPSFQNSDGLL